MENIITPKKEKVQLGLRVSPLTFRWLEEAAYKTGEYKEDVLERALRDYLGKFLGKQLEDKA